MPEGLPGPHVAAEELGGGVDADVGQAGDGRGHGDVDATAGEVGVDVVRGTLGPAREQRARVGEHHGVVVDVHDPGVGDDRLGDLVDVLRGRQPGADVEELADAVVLGERGHRAAHEVAVVPDVEVAARVGGQRGGRRVPVHGVVVLATEEDVVDPCRVRLGGVDSPPQLGGVLAERVAGHGALPGGSGH